MADTKEIEVTLTKEEEENKENATISEEEKQKRLDNFKYTIEKLVAISEGKKVTSRAQDERKKETLQILDNCFKSTQVAANLDPKIAEKNAVIAEQCKKLEEKKKKEAKKKKDAVEFAKLSEQKGKEEVAKLEASGVSLGEAKKKVEAIVAHSYILTAEAANKDPATAVKNKEIAEQRRKFEEANGIVKKKEKKSDDKKSEGNTKLDDSGSHIDPTKRALQKPKKKITKPIVVEDTAKSCGQEASLSEPSAFALGMQDFFSRPPILAFAFIAATLVLSSATSAR